MNVLIKVLFLAIAPILFTFAVNAQPGPPKFGALAVDRNNGFYYGWAYDQPTVDAAESKALGECTKVGGKCGIVLLFSGDGCGAYRTVSGDVGTAYGWGIAGTKGEADGLARNEAVKFSNGRDPSNFVWACNSTKMPLKVLKNEKRVRSVKIGNQVWMADNLDIATFRNGDPIPEVNNTGSSFGQDVYALSRAKKPWFYDPDGGKFGKTYNLVAATDPRGLCPQGWHIPSAAEWRTLLDFLGGELAAPLKLMNAAGWPVAGTNTTGFSAAPGGYDYNRSNKGKQTEWWATTMDGNYISTFQIRYAWVESRNGEAMVAKLSNRGTLDGQFIRCIQD